MDKGIFRQQTNHPKTRADTSEKNSDSDGKVSLGVSIPLTSIYSTDTHRTGKTGDNDQKGMPFFLPFL